MLVLLHDTAHTRAWPRTCKVAASVAPCLACRKPCLTAQTHSRVGRVTCQTHSVIKRAMRVRWPVRGAAGRHAQHEQRDSLWHERSPHALLAQCRYPEARCAPAGTMAAPALACLSVFLLASTAVGGPVCSAGSFPTALNDTMCYGLKEQVRNKMGAPISTLPECLDACCEDNSCTVYQ